jgi:hypothetical protein
VGPGFLTLRERSLENVPENVLDNDQPLRSLTLLRSGGGIPERAASEFSEDNEELPL